MSSIQHQTAHIFEFRVDPQGWNLKEFIFVVSDNSPLCIKDGRNALVVLVSRTVSGIEWTLRSCRQRPRVTVYGLEATGYNHRQNNYKIVASGDVGMAGASDDDTVYTIHLEEHGRSRSFTQMFGCNTKLDESDIKLTYNSTACPSEYTVSNLPEQGQTLVGLHTLLVLRQLSNNMEFCTIESGSNSSIDIGVPLSSVPMTKYEAAVFRLETSWKGYRQHELEISISSKVLKFGTYMTLQNLETLKERAVVHCYRRGNTPSPLTELWRNKPKSYFTDIMKNRDGVMKKYRKDYNGDQSSWLNGNMDGLFFSAALDIYTRKLPTYSYFGDTRFHVPVGHLFNDNHSLYFADFYCFGKIHYVTLVLTKKSSQADSQCQSRLLPLDMYENPFLRMKKDHALDCLMHRLTLTCGDRSAMVSNQPCACNSTVYAVVGTLVEVFYTEDIDIGRLRLLNPEKFYFTRVETKGRGKSRPRGIPKYSACKICNL